MVNNTTTTNTRSTAKMLIKWWYNKVTILLLVIIMTCLILCHRSTSLTLSFSQQQQQQQQQQQKHVSLMSPFHRTGYRSSAVRRSNFLSMMIPELQEKNVSIPKFDIQINSKMVGYYHRLRQWYMHKLILVRIISQKWMIRSLQCYMWFFAVFLLWNTSLPPAIATTQQQTTISTATTAQMPRSIRPKTTQTNAVNNDDTFHHQQHDTIIMTQQNGNTFPTKNRNNNNNNNPQQIRFITSSVVILVTSAIGIQKVHHRRRRNEEETAKERNLMVVDTNDNSIINMNSKNTDITTPTMIGSELNWLLPKNDNRDGTTTAGSSVSSLSDSVITTKPTTKPIIRNNTVVGTTNLVSFPTTKTETSWFTKGVTSSTKSVSPSKQQQQPKSVQEELELQVKYASIESLEERAYTILVDLGMVEKTTSDPFDSKWE